jgi:NAD(P)-dependent dehydrogenase (short-subunit alcohol dehydrogenase family)
MDLHGRVAVVTGAAAGAGRVIASRLASAGARVLVADVDSGNGQRVVDDIAAGGGAADFVWTDVCDEESIDSTVRLAAQAGGGPHILVNNAGGWGGAGRQFPAATPTEWGRVLDLNLRGPMLMTQRCLEPMRRAGGGAVVNVASSAGLELTAYASPEYGTAKAGLIRFSTCLANLGDSIRVRVNCVVPGWIGLERAHAELEQMTPEDRRNAPPLIPPEDVAAAVVRFVSSDHLAGRVLVLRGGSPPEMLDPAACAS